MLTDMEYKAQTYIPLGLHTRKAALVYYTNVEKSQIPAVKRLEALNLLRKHNKYGRAINCTAAKTPREEKIR